MLPCCSYKYSCTLVKLVQSSIVKLTILILKGVEQRSFFPFAVFSPLWFSSLAAEGVPAWGFVVPRGTGKLFEPETKYQEQRSAKLE